MGVSGRLCGTTRGCPMMSLGMQHRKHFVFVGGDGGVGATSTRPTTSDCLLLEVVSCLVVVVLHFPRGHSPTPSFPPLGETTFKQDPEKDHHRWFRIWFFLEAFGFHGRWLRSGSRFDRIRFLAIWVIVRMHSWPAVKIVSLHSLVFNRVMLLASQDPPQSTGGGARGSIWCNG